MTMVEEKQYAVDQEKLKEYFPMEVVTAGMMDIYQRILGLKFTRLEGGEVWHEDVEMWRVRKIFYQTKKYLQLSHTNCLGGRCRERGEHRLLLPGPVPP